MSQAPTTTPFIRRSVSLGSLVLIASIAGCGGGSDSASPAPSPSPAPAPATTSVSTTVIDGALQNVKVCLDRNDNGSCDSEEPSALTNASGKANLEVPEADVGKHPILALVTKDSVDADTGAVPVAFMLRAPADQPGVVSPLSTLVHAHSQATGSSTSDAAAAIQSRLGLGTSALADFTQDGSNAGKLTATMARLIVVTTQTQLTNTAGATGVDGAPLTSVQLNAAVNSVLLQQLQTLATAVLDNPALSDTSTSMKDKQSAMETAAQQVASASGVTAGNVGLIAAMQAQTTSPEVGAPRRARSCAGSALPTPATTTFEPSRPRPGRTRPMRTANAISRNFASAWSAARSSPGAGRRSIGRAANGLPAPPISYSRPPASPAAKPNPCTARAWSAEPSKACAISPA